VNCFGVTGKLYCEAVEEMDMEPIKALRVAGNSRSQVFVHAVVPGVVPTLIGLWLYRLDSNFRDALTLGVVGAGGIGFLINQSLQLFQYRQVSTEVLVMLIWVLIFERLSKTARNRLVRNESLAASGHGGPLRGAFRRLTSRADHS
jgi:phosphonate transport system permease protein